MSAKSIIVRIPDEPQPVSTGWQKNSRPVDSVAADAIEDFIAREEWRKSKPA